MDALGQRLAQMQAAILRLDGLGQRLVDMADLDRGEFDFGRPPAQGGPDELADAGPIQAPDLLAALDDLSRQIDDRQRQLNALETLLFDRQLKKAGRPSGRPVRRGWLSSPYGKRTDPFTGRPARHRGIDFAGRRGSEVVAVAAGVVTWSGPRSGYGNLVEINHGNGYVTRYGHNEQNLVEVGERVRKGQQIARMGSSGRSTGPHVHFEVLRHGRQINPARFIARR
jgi:murein DD-endopeptidase MepM/ murein hydrolase activator NlpD